MASQRGGSNTAVFGCFRSTTQLLLMLFAVALILQAIAHMHFAPADSRHASSSLHHRFEPAERSTSGHSSPQDKHELADAMASKCLASLNEYHIALTNWFTGQTKEGEVFEKLEAPLKLHETFQLRVPQGQVFDKRDTMRALRRLYNTENQGSVHTPTQARVVHKSPESVTVAFTEEQRRGGSDPLTVKVDTTALCVPHVEVMTGQETDDVRWLWCFEAFGEPAASAGNRHKHI